MSTAVVVFDLDDTLYLERDYVLSGLHAAAHLLDDAVDRQRFLADAWRRFESGQRRSLIDDAMFGLALEHPIEASALVEAYRSHMPTISLPPDAKSALRCARTRFDATALLTDGRAVGQRNKIAALGINEWFELIIVTDEHGGPDAWKPNPHCFKLIEQYLHTAGDQLVYVADNPHKDFLAPRALGWKTIRIRRPSGLHVGLTVEASLDADCSIASLDELFSGPVGRYLDD